MTGLESRQLLCSTDQMFERHDDGVSGGVNARIPHALLDCDYDPPKPVQLLIGGQASEPANARLRQTGGKDPLAALQ
jgi:hypothetical protein